MQTRNVWSWVLLAALAHAAGAAPASASAAEAAAAGVVKINIGQDAINPTPARTAAIRHAAGMHDLQFDGVPVWQWNGKEYDVPGSTP
jgi:hypothetical protein